MGGFHLSGVTEKIIPETVADLKRFGLGVLAPGHCTGWRAMSRLAHEFGDELVPTAVGKRFAGSAGAPQMFERPGGSRGAPLDHARLERCDLRGGRTAT